MTNAKQEFLNHLVDISTKERIVKCAKITVHSSVVTQYELKINYTKEEQELFLESIDFVYYSGYGTQNLYGTIWYTDGTWSSRGEYDGSEWWEFNECPEVPKELQ